MASYNKVMIIGNLTRDPEIKYTPKGTAIADIGLAVNRNYTTDSGEKREEVTFIDVTLWGRVAEIVGEYCKKGRPLFVEGRPVPSTSGLFPPEHLQWRWVQAGSRESNFGIA